MKTVLATAAYYTPMHSVQLRDDKPNFSEYGSAVHHTLGAHIITGGSRGDGETLDRYGVDAGTRDGGRQVKSAVLTSENDSRIAVYFALPPSDEVPPELIKTFAIYAAFQSVIHDLDPSRTETFGKQGSLPSRVGVHWQPHEHGPFGPAKEMRLDPPPQVLDALTPAQGQAMAWLDNALTLDDGDWYRLVAEHGYGQFSF